MQRRSVSLSNICVSEQPLACQAILDTMSAPKDLEKGTYLKPLYFVLDNGQVFHDKLLPDPVDKLTLDFIKYSREYYIDLHYNVSSYQNYNHLSARIPLNHSNLKVSKFRELLSPNYDDMVILQYMEFGFPSAGRFCFEESFKKSFECI